MVNFSICTLSIPGKSRLSKTKESIPVVHLSGSRWGLRFREGPYAEGVLDQGQLEGEGGSAEPPRPAGHRQQPDGRHHQSHPRQEGGGGSRPEPGVNAIKLFTALNNGCS
jgi:hypothetical protein